MVRQRVKISGWNYKLHQYNITWDTRVLWFEVTWTERNRTWWERILFSMWHTGWKDLCKTSHWRYFAFYLFFGATWEHSLGTPWSSIIVAALDSRARCGYLVNFFLVFEDKFSKGFWIKLNQMYAYKKEHVYRIEPH